MDRSVKKRPAFCCSSIPKRYDPQKSHMDSLKQAYLLWRRVFKTLWTERDIVTFFIREIWNPLSAWTGPRETVGRSLISICAWPAQCHPSDSLLLAVKKIMKGRRNRSGNKAYHVWKKKNQIPWNSSAVVLLDDSWLNLSKKKEGGCSDPEPNMKIWWHLNRTNEPQVLSQVSERGYSTRWARSSGMEKHSSEWRVHEPGRR